MKDTREIDLREIIEEGYKHADVLVDHEDFVKAYDYGERELARVEKILPKHDFHNLLLQRVTIELQYLASESKFPPELIAAKSAAITDYCEALHPHPLVEEEALHQHAHPGGRCAHKKDR